MGEFITVPTSRRNDTVLMKTMTPPTSMTRSFVNGGVSYRTNMQTNDNRFDENHEPPTSVRRSFAFF